MVALGNISEPQTITVKKTYFRSWPAHDERNAVIPLRAYQHNIRFDTATNGTITFTYKKDRLFNLLAFLFSIAWDMKRRWQSRRIRPPYHTTDT